MEKFMSDNFLLSGEVGRTLYFAYAESLPIIDYHCHLSPKEIAEDKHYANITEVWLYGDHYKWRAMRSCGVDEAYITGDASDYEKFRAYCRIMPKLIGNPLYHWSHLELKRYFDCDLIINEENCDEIWRLTAEKLQFPDMSARQLMTRSGVVLVCTTDDPADDLAYHAQIAQSDFSVKVLPTFRPDKAMNIERRGIAAYLKTLGEANGTEISDLFGLQKALAASLDRFALVRMDYRKAIETAVAFGDNALVDFCEQYRKSAEKNGIKVIVSYRAIGRLAKMMSALGQEEAMRTCLIKGLGKDDVRMISNGIDNGNKYKTALLNVINAMEEN